MRKFRYIGLMIVLVLVFCLTLTACGKDTLTGITLDTNSVQKEFAVGDEFTYEGLIVTANYSKGKAEAVTDYTVSTPDMTTDGAKTVTVTYQDKTASYQITVSKANVEPQRELQSISINTDRVKKQFTVGDTFTYEGIVVTAHYNVAPLTQEITTGYNVSNPDMTSKGSKVITVSYEGKTARYTITVNEAAIVERELQSISINTDNVQKKFYVGDTFNYDNLVVTAHYNVAPLTEEITTGYDVSTPDMDTADTYTITVTYMEKTATYTITVSEPPVVIRELQSISIVTDDVQKAFWVGDTFNYDNLVVTAHYNVEPLTETVTEYTVNESDIDMSVAGNKTVIVTYQEKTAQYDITVKEPELIEITVNANGATTVFTVGSEFSYAGIVVTAHYENDTEKIITDYDVNTDELDMDAPGTYTITVTYENKEATYQVTVKAATLERIEVNADGAKKVFYVGDQFSYAGIVVTAYFDDDSSIAVTGYEVSKPNMDEAAESLTITVSYQGKEATYTIEIKAVELERIEVNYAEAKTVYFVGDTFSADGIVVTAYYNNGSSRELEVDDYEVSKPNMDEAAESLTITVSYQGKEATYTIEIKAVELERIEVNYAEAKTVYFVGDTFSADGIVVTAYYNNGSSTELDVGDYEVSTPNMHKAAESLTITVRYQDKEATYTIEIKAVELERIEVNDAEAKKDYFIGDEFSADGIVVTAYYNNGSSTELGVDDYEVSAPNMSNAGTETITITYQQKTATYSITIKEPSVKSISVNADGAKKNFFVGDEFSFAGIVVTVYYENNTYRTLAEDEYEVAVPDMTKAAESLIITVSYQGESDTYTITLVEPALTSISVDATGAKVKFYVDDVFSYDGLVVTAQYENGSSKQLEKGTYEISTPDMTTTGSKQVTVKYNGMEDEYTITVEYKIFAEVYTGEQSLILDAEDAMLDSTLKIGNDGASHGGKYVGNIYKNNKITFMFNSSVAETVELYLSMGRKETIDKAFYVYVNDPNRETQYSVDLVDTGNWTAMKEFYICRVSLVEGPNTIVVVANSNEVNVDYLLIVPSPDLEIERLEVNTDNATTKFYIGDTFSYTGIVVTAHFNNGTFATIERGYRVSTPDMTTEGTKTVTVTYQEVNATYEITVEYKVFAEVYNGESIIYEAEYATREGRSNVQNNGSFRGGSFVGNIANGDKLTFMFNSAVEGKVELYLAISHGNDGITRAFDVYVNGDNVTPFDVKNSGSWTTVVELFVCRVNLVQGRNVIVFDAINSGASVNIDYLRVAPDSSSDPSLVLDRIEVDITNAKTDFNIGDSFVTEGLVVKAWYSNQTFDIVDNYDVDEPDMETTGIKTVTVTYSGKSATYEITVKDPSVPDPAWAMTKISLRAEEDSKVYIVLSGTYVSYNQEDLQSTLYAALQWDIRNADNPGSYAPSDYTRIFVYGENDGTWEIKIEITFGSADNYFKNGRYFIDYTNPQNDTAGLYTGKWTIGESVSLGSYKYEFCVDTYWGTVTFRISGEVNSEAPTYDGSELEVSPSNAKLQGGGELQYNGLGASDEGSIIGGIAAGCSITFTVISNGAASVNLKVFLSSGSGYGAGGWENGQTDAFEIYVNGQSVGKFDGKGEGYTSWNEYLVENLSLVDGENTIEIRFLAGNANFSHLTILPATASADEE